MEPLPPFGQIGHAEAARVRASYTGCACVVICPTPFGGANLPNLEAALSSGRPLVLVGGMDGDRDFTGGVASRLWETAVTRGAVRVDTEAEVAGAVERLIRTET